MHVPDSFEITVSRWRTENEALQGHTLQAGSKLKHPIQIPTSQNHNLQELLNNYQTIFCGTTKQLPSNYQTTTPRNSKTTAKQLPNNSATGFGRNPF